MGRLCLGALLGVNHSFESFISSSGQTLPESWTLPGSQCAFSAATGSSAVHSSATALQAQVGSSGGSLAVLRQGYAGGDDLPRWDPAVTTHAVQCRAWVRAADAPSSGHLRLRLQGAADAVGGAIAYAATLQPNLLQTTASSAAPPALQLERVAGAMTGATALLDDLLTTIDPLTLDPEWDLRVQRVRVARQHRGATGRWGERDTGHYWRAAVTVGALDRPSAERLLWWWETRAPLALTWDSSDSAATLTGHLTGEAPPVLQAQRPYAARYHAVLRFESLDGGSLVY